MRVEDVAGAVLAVMAARVLEMVMSAAGWVAAVRADPGAKVEAMEVVVEWGWVVLAEVVVAARAHLLARKAGT